MDGPAHLLRAATGNGRERYVALVLAAPNLSSTACLREGGRSVIDAVVRNIAGIGNLRWRRASAECQSVRSGHSALMAFFQVYWLGSGDRILQVLERAREAAAKGIILTLDSTFAHRRDWQPGDPRAARP